MSDITSNDGKPNQNVVPSGSADNPASTNNTAEEDLSQQGMKIIMDIIKISNGLPMGQQRELLNTFPEFVSSITKEGDFILSVLSNAIRNEGIAGNIIRRDIEEKHDMIVDTNDIILERVDINLDEIQGIKRNPDPVLSKIAAAKGAQNRNSPIVQINGPNSATPPLKDWSKNRAMVRLINTRITHRPQIKFKDKIDNRNIPFEPRITDKPNSLKPLAILVEEDEEHGESFSHPYEYELDLFKPREEQLLHRQPIAYKALDEVPFLIVNDNKSLEEMMNHLKCQNEIAVDVEHHSYRTFQGITCLLQISSRERDFVIDALELRDRLHVLNDVFTDPKIVKVLHGADSDIQWLQRDLCVYIVNMFDTHQAAQVLDFHRLSLAHLLKVFCNIDSNKTYQLYDWRTRPLSDEAIRYAREDTHYLLYIYDLLRNQLIEKCKNNTNLLESVIYRSTQICKKKYWKVMLNEESHMDLYRKSRKLYDNRQMYALRRLYMWRDKIAREEDESYAYVLPNHMLLQISESLPREMQGILACCNPVPPLVRQNLLMIHKILLEAREQSLVKKHIETEAQRQSIEQAPNWKPVNVESKLYCPHDLSCSDELPENLPTVLLGGLRLEPANCALSAKCAINVFADEQEFEEMNQEIVRKNLRFVSPYQRYKKVISVENQEEEEARQNSKDKEKRNEFNKNAENQTNETKVQDRTTAAEVQNKPVPEHLSDKDIDAFEASQRQIAKRKREESPPNSNRPAEVQTPVESHKKKKKKLDNDLPLKNLDTPKRNKQKAPQTTVVEQPTEDDSVIPNLLGDQTDDEKTKSKSEKRKSEDNKDQQDSAKSEQKKSKRDETFQPYNYEAFDFTKFQTQEKPKKVPKQTQQNNSRGRRTPWLGKKMKKAGL
ncbi:exosome component 10 isoform X2 [Nilaparvata lugens]|uniref:exosome component 10 isoform X2 n=1 Tax=Nilaparvata lugens TaxID=108931 RepID=UPI00193DB23E|nr:exosome component 10 isoform X2 [Nilaparvata lugens]